jgi:two-component system OmpR family response regulator
MSIKENGDGTFVGETLESMPDFARHKSAEDDLPRAVVVDDDPGFLADLTEFLSGRGFKVWGVATEAELFALLDEDDVELVILDILLGEVDGRDIAKRLRESSDVGILILTALSKSCDHVTGLDSGADAYLVKTADLLVIEATLRSILRRLSMRGGREDSEAKGSPLAKSWQLDAINWALLSPNANAVKLSAIERQLLLSLMENPGVPVERRSLVRSLNKPDNEAGIRSLDTIVRRLRIKVKDFTDLQLPLESVYGQGYVFTAMADIAR